MSVHEFTKMTPFTVDEVGRLVLAHDEVIDIAGKDAGQIAEQIREYAARKTYPLYCVDRQDRVSPEHQYRGPFATHDEAHEQAEPDDLIRRCRRVRTTEIDGWETAVCDMLEQLDERATSGELPDGAWGDFEDTIVEDQRDNLVDAMRALLDEHVRVNAYICEGDE